ncbi:MAG: hypothetical protein ACOC9Y_09820, partial [Chloroflexota bacterium]
TGVDGPRATSLLEATNAEPRPTGDEHRARRWFEEAIGNWETEGRVTASEAVRLRDDLRQPTFLKVLPHFGVHLVVGSVLRFPFGSIVRSVYVLLNIAVTMLRFLLRRINSAEWRALMSVHSPVVLVLAAFPGIGTFSYLASRPVRGNHLLLRIGLDAVLLKIPRRMYERTGLRWLLARPRGSARRTDRAEGNLEIPMWAQTIVLLQALVIGALLAGDLLSKVVNELQILNPEMIFWKQFARMLDLGAETSFGTWYQVMALAFLSIGLAAIGTAKGRAGDRFHRHWQVLALLALGFSIDEQVKIHDAGGGTAALRDDLGLSGPFYFGWVIVGLLSVLIVVVAYRRFFFALPESTRRIYAGAALLYVGGEIVLESFAGWYVDWSGNQDHIIYHSISSIEEFLGMAGIFLAIAGTLHYLQRHYGAILLQLEESAVATEELEDPALNSSGDRSSVERRTSQTHKTPIGLIGSMVGRADHERR